MANLPSKLEFVSFLQYSPRGTTPVSANSQDVMRAIKDDKWLTTATRQVNAIDYAARRLREEFDNFDFLKHCFGPDVTLIPMPRSSPFRDPDALWPAKRICESIQREGIARDVLTCLRRVRPVQKASLAKPSQRPKPPDHHDSVHVDVQHGSSTPVRITIVDDVITRGSSFVGVFPRLQNAFPGVPIACFALIRTRSDVDIDVILAPVAGTIRYRGSGWPRRDP